MHNLAAIERIEAQIRELSADDQQLLLQRVAAQLLMDTESQAVETHGPVLSDEEVDQLLQTPDKRLSGPEIVKAGLLGAWEGKGITDSVEWLAEQRRKRRERNSW